MEAFIGSILLVPYNFTPQGWLLCDGRVLSIMQNQALFSLLGIQFGGDGHSNFALPKLEAPVENMRYIIAVGGTYPSHS
jgi:microcystin-dependent protein